MLPAEVRRRAQEIRAASQQLVKQSGQFHDRADVLMREAEVAVALLRDAIKQSATEALGRIIRFKLGEGRLPQAGVPATIPGRPGDGSVCGACDHVVSSRELIMLVSKEEAALSSPRGVTRIPLHADCFELRNRERKRLSANS
jgi:hypothetical protein